MFRFWVVILFTVFVSGCSVLERIWLVPRQNTEIEIPAHISPDNALSTFAKISSKYFFKTNSDVTYRDSDSIEIGNWNESNLTGYSARAEINKNGKTLSFIIKGVNAYYSDLPVLDPETKNRVWVELPMEYTAKNIELKIIKSFEQR